MTEPTEQANERAAFEAAVEKKYEQLFCEPFPVVRQDLKIIRAIQQAEFEVALEELLTRSQLVSSNYSAQYRAQFTKKARERVLDLWQLRSAYKLHYTRTTLHPDTFLLLERFAVALEDKLSAAETKYGYSNGWLSADWMDECRAKLREHVEKGDPRDVAAYCAFLWHHNESTAPPARSRQSQPAQASGEAVRIARDQWHALNKIQGIAMQHWRPGEDRLREIEREARYTIAKHDAFLAQQEKTR
jgi:hypothetical protein